MTASDFERRFDSESQEIYGLTTVVAFQTGSKEIGNAHLVLGFLRYQPMKGVFLAIGLRGDHFETRFGLKDEVLSDGSLIHSREFNLLLGSAQKLSADRGSAKIGKHDLLEALVEEERTLRLFLTLSPEEPQIDQAFEELERITSAPEQRQLSKSA